MKIFLLIVSLCALSFQGKTQYTKDSVELVNRLDIFMQNNRLMDFDKVLDYTYPKLFTIAPREEIKEAMESAFNSEELLIKMDSLKVVVIYPLFAEKENRYAKVTYSMLINMQLVKEDSIGIKSFLETMQSQFGEKNVTIDKTGNGINIFQQIDMAAVKDDLSPQWTFVNLKKEDPIMDMLFEKDLIARFYTY